MRKFLFVRTEIFCLPHGTNFSFGAKKIFQAWKIFFPPKEKRALFGRKNAFFRRAKNFRAHAGKFLCAQK